MTPDRLGPAAFITNEDGDDLIVSFAIQDLPDDNVESLTLLRTPALEFALDPSERGVDVSFEDSPRGELDLLKTITFSRDVVQLATARRGYIVDISRVEEEEVQEARRILELMNFDHAFSLQLE